MKTKATTSLRVLAFLIDAVTLIILISPFVIVNFLLGMNNSLYFQLFTSSLFFALFMCKDIIGGRSFGKRKLHLDIINAVGEGRVSASRLILRNFFLLFAPIEIVVLLFNPSKRLGDIVAGTEIVMTERGPSAKLSKGNYIAFIITLFIVYAVSYLGLLALGAGAEVLKMWWS